MDEAERLAHRVAIIDHGKLLVLDTPDALKRSLGSGDVLEIEYTGGNGNPVPHIPAALSALVEECIPSGHSLLLRAHHMVDKLPAVMDLLKQSGAQVGEVKLRTNTLEDVFIALTGRRLRE